MTEKLILGGMTPEEAHAKLAFGPNAKCNGCGRRPVARCITMAPLVEAMRRYPAVALLAQTDEQALLEHVVPIRENKTDKRPTPYVRIGIAHACRTCKLSLERESAKAPSWCIVEWNHGPGTRTTVGMGGNRRTRRAAARDVRHAARDVVRAVDKPS